MSDEEIQEKILKFLHLRKQAGIRRESRVSHLPEMLGITVESFERNVLLLHESRLVNAMAAPSFDGRLNYFHIELTEDGSGTVQASPPRERTRFAI